MWYIVIPWLNDVCRQNQGPKFLPMMLKASTSCWTTMIRRSRWTSLLEMVSKELLEKLRNLSRAWGEVHDGLVLDWRGWDWLKLASRCSRTLIQTSSEQQQLDEKLWRCLLISRFWRIGRGCCLARLQCLVSSSHLQGLVRHHFYCWAFKMMILMKYVLLKFSLSFVISHFLYILDAFAELQKANISFVMSVCLSIRPSARMELFGFHWTELHEIWWAFFENLSRKFKCH